MGWGWAPLGEGLDAGEGRGDGAVHPAQCPHPVGHRLREPRGDQRRQHRERAAAKLGDGPVGVARVPPIVQSHHRQPLVGVQLEQRGCQPLRSARRPRRSVGVVALHLVADQGAVLTPAAVAQPDRRHNDAANRRLDGQAQLHGRRNDVGER